ncbi:MAG: aegerolysin family protein [Thiohalomonadales bacterium]|nr:aegerolysin family protein [Thiohalomonadales bacterium]
MASRSVQVHFNNSTDSVLTLKKAALSHGEWSQDDSVPGSVAAGQQNVQWGSESDGFMTGTEGSATFTLGSGGEVTLNWDNPYYGSNSYSSSVPGGFKCTYTGGGEDNANVTFTLEPA